MKLIRAIVPAVVTVAALVFASAPAQAATTDVEGYFNPSTWTYFSVVRQTTVYGSITFEPTSKSCSGIYLALAHPNTTDVWSRVTFWGCNDWRRKILASDVLAGTRFIMAGDKTSNTTTDRRFTGTLRYPT